MNKKFIVIPIVTVTIIFLIGTIYEMNSTDNSNIEKSRIIFHITLADPNLYSNGVYTNTFTVNKGEYLLRFVPNGSSPENLSILLQGTNFDFKEDYKLKSTLHQTGISEYFTWEYIGQKTIEISESQEIRIIVNPNGNIMGSVSVDIIEN